MDQHSRTILITGGTGFIASYLAMQLLENDSQKTIKEIVLFDRDQDMTRLMGFNKGPNDPGAPNYDPSDRYNAVKDRITFVQGDLSLLPHVLSVFDVYEPTSVYHLGALLSAGAETNPTMGFQVDLVGSWNVLEAARLYFHTHGKHRNLSEPLKVIFPSTIASFGSFIAPGAKVKNEDIQMPTTMYGVSKVAVERLGEYYASAKRKWVDFRAVRFPSVIGAARGPGGTTVYSTLLIQLPAQGKPYEVYVPKDTPLDILYVKDACDALIQLHDAPPEKLKRRVYNIAGIRIGDQAPQAGDIEKALKDIKADSVITYTENKLLSDIVRTFGILDDSMARQDWDWQGAKFDLPATVSAFIKDVNDYPNRIKALELFG